MIFEQAKEFNDLASPPVPWTRERVWRQAKVLMPLVVLAYLSFAESLFLRGVPVADGLGAILAMSVSFLVLIGFLGGISVWARKRSGRTLELKKKCIQIKPCQVRSIRWSNVRCFQVEPAGADGELKRVTIQYTTRSSSVSQFWAMVFADRIQCETLLAELRKRREAGTGRFDIKIFDSPVAPLKEYRPKAGPIWLRALAMFLYLNGIPLLMVGAFPQARHSRNGVHHAEVNPHLVAWRNQFSKTHDLRTFMVVTGGILTGVGIGVLRLSTVLQRRQRMAYQARVS